MVQNIHKNVNSILVNKIQSHKFTSWIKGKGWSYYDYQIKVLEAVYEKKDALVISPIGSGKTVAGFLPTIINSGFHSSITSSIAGQLILFLELKIIVNGEELLVMVCPTATPIFLVPKSKANICIIFYPPKFQSLTISRIL